MELLTRGRRLRAFKATDAFAVEAHRVSVTLRSNGLGGLIDAIRRVARRSGGALVAAAAEPAGGSAERRLLARAREELVEGRYYLYLARRLGLLDVKRYRALTTRQDVALRELDLLLSPGATDDTKLPP